MPASRLDQLLQEAEGEERPSLRRLAEQLRIPRERLPGLYETLGDLLERCRAANSGRTAVRSLLGKSKLGNLVFGMERVDPMPTDATAGSRAISSFSRQRRTCRWSGRSWTGGPASCWRSPRIPARSPAARMSRSPPSSPAGRSACAAGSASGWMPAFSSRSCARERWSRTSWPRRSSVSGGWNPEISKPLRSPKRWTRIPSTRIGSGRSPSAPGPSRPRPGPGRGAPLRPSPGPRRTGWRRCSRSWPSGSRSGWSCCAARWAGSRSRSSTFPPTRSCWGRGTGEARSWRSLAGRATSCSCSWWMPGSLRRKAASRSSTPAAERVWHSSRVHLIPAAEFRLVVPRGRLPDGMYSVRIVPDAGGLPIAVKTLKIATSE